MIMEKDNIFDEIEHLEKEILDNNSIVELSNSELDYITLLKNLSNENFETYIKNLYSQQNENNSLTKLDPLLRIVNIVRET